MAPDTRLRRNRDIREVYKRGDRYRTGGMSLFCLRRVPVDAAPARRAICPVRGFKTAVGRNRHKRICREAYRSWADRVVEGFDLVFAVYPERATARHRVDQMGELLRKAQLMAEELW